MVSEGIETGAAAMTATGSPVWAALSTSGMISLVLPRLPLAAAVVILADHDANGAGERAARAAAQRWLAEGRRVRIALPPEPGTDFADLLLGSSGSRDRWSCDAAAYETGPAIIGRIIGEAAEVTPEPWPEPDRSLLEAQDIAGSAVL